MQLIAHRGLASIRPCGAPLAEDLERALRTPGVAMVEVDVRATAGGAVVVVHDASCGEGPVRALSLDAVRRSAPGLLTLEEALEHIDGRLPLLLDVKEAEVVEPLAEALAGVRDPAAVAVCDEDPAALAHLRETASTVARWLTLPRVGEQPGARRRRIVACARRTQLARQVEALAAEVAAAGVCVDRWAVTPGLCARARAGGLAVAAWTVNRPATARRLARLGVTHLTTDAPAAMAGALGLA